MFIDLLHARGNHNLGHIISIQYITFRSDNLLPHFMYRPPFNVIVVVVVDKVEGIIVCVIQQITGTASAPYRKLNSYMSRWYRLSVISQSQAF